MLINMEHEFILYISSDQLPREDATIKALCQDKDSNVVLMCNQIISTAKDAYYRFKASPRFLIPFIKKYKKNSLGVSFELFEFRSS